jgi:anti-anti-sigma factor
MVAGDRARRTIFRRPGVDDRVGAARKNRNENCVSCGPMSDRGPGPTTFSIRVTSDGVTVVSLFGELDVTTVDELRPSLNSLVARRLPRVEFDLSRLRMIDSIGTGVLVAFYKGMRAHGGDVVLRETGGQPLAILRLVHLDRVLLQP